VISIIYYLVVTPIALASRIFYDPLSRRRGRQAATYWSTPKAPKAEAPGTRLP